MLPEFGSIVSRKSLKITSSIFEPSKFIDPDIFSVSIFILGELEK